MAEETYKEKQTPTTYKYYDKQYNYDDLERSVYEGLNSYLSGLKRGEKDEQLFRNAAANMLAGIKDGTITWSNGRFKDSKGRYSNGTWYDENNVKQSSKKKSKDYYGLVANYIYNNLGKSGEYKPEEKKPWDSNAAMTSALMQEIFNSDKGNMADFYGLDSQTKTNTNRVKALYNALTNIKSNWQTKMSKYNPTEEDYNAYLPYLDAAINALSDNKIGDDGYLTLSRAVNDMDWRSMLSNDIFKEKPTEQQNQQVVSTGNPQHDSFNQFVNTNYPRLYNKSEDFDISTNTYVGPWNNKQLSSYFSKLSDQELGDTLAQAVVNPNFTYINHPEIGKYINAKHLTGKHIAERVINEMINRHLLIEDPENPNIYYIKEYKTNQNAVFYIDKKNKTVHKRAAQDVPFYRDVIFNKWRSTIGQNSWTDEYFTESNK